MAELRAQLGNRSPADRALEAMLRSGWAGDHFGARPEGLSMELLEAHPHGIDLGALTPQLPGLLRTVSGRIELAAAPLADDVERLQRWLDEVPDGTTANSRGARRAPARAVQQLVDAQRQRSGEGPRALHAAGSPR